MWQHINEYAPVSKGHNIEKDELRIPSNTLDEYYKFVTLRYQQESARPNNLNTKVSIYITATALILGGIAPFYSRFPFGTTGLYILFYSLIALAVLLLSIIVWNFIYFFWGYQYAYPPENAQIAGYITKLRVYFLKYSDYYRDIGNCDLLVDKAFKIYMVGILSECIDRDYKVNNNKTAALVIIGRSISIVFVIILLSLLVYFLIKI